MNKEQIIKDFGRKEGDAPFKTIKKKNKELNHNQSKILVQGVNGKNKVKCNGFR